MNRIVRSIKKGARCWAGIFLSALLMFTMYACTGKAQELESSVKNESFASESVNLGENDSPAVSSEEDRLQERGILREELSRKRSRYESLEYWACLERIPLNRLMYFFSVRLSIWGLPATITCRWKTLE